MRALAAPCAILTTYVLAQAVEPPPIETAVKTAVENFEPLWSPTKGQLRGWVIGINAAANTPAGPNDNLADLNLVTAAYLYHFVLAAGGSPVLTRADGTRTATPTASDWQRRASLVREAGCDLCVSIRYDKLDQQAAVWTGPAPANPDDRKLADALRTTLDAATESASQPTSDAAFLDALRQMDRAGHIGVCGIVLAAPPASPPIDAATRKACFDNARRLYLGLARFCRDRTARRPPAPLRPVPETPSSKRSKRIATMARSIWPEGRLPDERLDWFCQRFAQSALTNHTLVYFDVSAQREADVVALHGCTNAPPVAVGLRHALRTVGIPNTRNEVRPLPNRDRLGEHLFGVCRASTALTYSQPSPGSGLQTQLLFGEPLFLLDRDDEYYLLHAGDGYWGWVPQAAVQAMTAEQFDAYLRHPQAAVLEDIEGPQVRIPRGASLPLVQTTDTERTLLLPDGSTLGAPAAATALGNTAQQQAAARVRAGLDLLYVPYVFGGRSPLGLDCSGLMSNVYARAGDRPPRDAWQQALAGRLVATAWHRAGIQGGDQLFFINETGKIYHTGIALDAVHVLHSAPPCVQIGSLDPQDPLYDLELNRNFLLAKRP